MATAPVAPETLQITGNTSLTTQEANTITPENQQWTPSFAKKIALADFRKAESQLGADVYEKYARLATELEKEWAV